MVQILCVYCVKLRKVKASGVDIFKVNFFIGKSISFLDSTVALFI